MQNIILRTLGGMVVSCIMTVCNVSAEQTVVFTVGEWPPFVSETMANYGPTAEIVSIACKEAGLKAKFQFTSWSRAYHLVKTGKAVASFPWKWTDVRADEVHFPKTPIMVSKEYVYYLKSKFPKGINATTLEVLKPYKMVGVLSYWYEKPAQKAGVDMHLVSKAETAWKMLKIGRRDAYIENELVAKHAIKSLYPKEYQTFDHSKDPITQADMFVLFSRVHPNAKEFMGKIETAMKKLKDQGVINTILNE